MRRVVGRWPGLWWLLCVCCLLRCVRVCVRERGGHVHGDGGCFPAPLSHSLALSHTHTHKRTQVDIPGINDSKQVTEEDREALYEVITTTPGVLWAA